MHLQALKVWRQDLARMFSERVVQLVLALVVVCLSLVLVYVLALRHIVITLEHSYKDHRNIYETYLPQLVVNELRTVKAKLVINKVLPQ